MLAERYGVKGQTLRKQYKEKISDYRNWDQLEHAHDYLLYPENIGENLSLDETCLSNGDVYTILTNKAAKGRKGALVAMVRGVATDAVSGILRRLPHRKRLSVKTVTTDLSSAMMLTVRKVFPAAKLINDRFHVQQLMSEAVDRLRIRYRWKVLDAENQAIREHRQKKKEAKSKAERERIGKWEPERMENGETLPQIVSRSKHIILKHWSKWNEQQKTRAAILFDKFPKLLEGYSLSMKLTDIFNKKSGPDEARLNLARWYNEVEKFDYMEFNKVLDTFSNHSTTIINYFEERLTNASAESFNAKIGSPDKSGGKFFNSIENLHLCTMNNQGLLALAQLILPSEILSNFEVVRVEEEASLIRIYLDESVKAEYKENPEIESKGFCEAVTIRDFPIRDKGVDLIVRRRKWYDKQNNRYFSDSYDLKAEETRYSKEFAAFLKGVYGDDSYDLPFA